MTSSTLSEIVLFAMSKVVLGRNACPDISFLHTRGRLLWGFVGRVDHVYRRLACKRIT